jgi:hypothetical protein
MAALHRRCGRGVKVVRGRQPLKIAAPHGTHKTRYSPARPGGSASALRHTAVTHETQEATAPAIERLPVSFAAPAAEEWTMKSRKGLHDDVPSGGGDLENWLHDLVGGEATARRLRERLRAEGEGPEDACAVCEGSATGKIYFGPEGHLHGRRSA